MNYYKDEYNHMSYKQYKLLYTAGTASYRYGRSASLAVIPGLGFPTLLWRCYVTAAELFTRCLY